MYTIHVVGEAEGNEPEVCARAVRPFSSDLVGRVGVCSFLDLLGTSVLPCFVGRRKAPSLFFSFFPGGVQDGGLCLAGLVGVLRD